MIGKTISHYPPPADRILDKSRHDYRRDVDAHTAVGGTGLCEGGMGVVYKANSFYK